MNKKVIIVGAGIGGLAAALRIRHLGYEVEVFDANSYAGGKIHELEIQGYRFDTGPSLFTLPYLVDELFRLYGENPLPHFQYTQKDILCQYFWQDGTRFTAKSKETEFIAEACKTFDTDEGTLLRYLKKSKKKYDLTASLFLEKSLHKFSSYLSYDNLKTFLLASTLDLTSTLHATNNRYFKDKRLVQLFDRYATYNGSSPYKTPGVMSLISHLEMHLGTYFPKGGMKAISRSLYEFAVSKGITFHFDERVQKIEVADKQIKGITTHRGFYAADLVVSNADIFNSYHSLLQEIPAPERILSQERSSAAIIFYWGIDRSFPELDLHNILFGNNYQQEFDEIFRQKTIPTDPTVYINITSKEEKGDAPEGGENWFVMINTAANFGQDWDLLIGEAKKRIVQTINTALKTDIEKHIVCEAILDPRTIESKTGSHRGSLYGASSNSMFAAFLRHANFSKSIKGLYFCGGSVHPGGGIPLCLLSAKIAAELIQSDYATH